jgi:hypothetical protein
VVSGMGIKWPKGPVRLAEVVASSVAKTLLFFDAFTTHGSRTA